MISPLLGVAFAYSIQILAFLCIFISICYYFRKSTRLYIILIVLFVYIFAPFKDNSFYLCKYKNNNNNNLLLKFQKPIECIHSSSLYKYKEGSTKHNFCFSVSPLLHSNKSELEFYNSCNYNICFSRIDDEINKGCISQFPKFKTNCTSNNNNNNYHEEDYNELSIDSSGFYIIGNDKHSSRSINNNNNVGSKGPYTFIITKPIINNIDNDGYFIFMLSFIIFMKEIVYTDSNQRLSKRLLSFSIFTILFLIPCIFLVTIKQKNDQLFNNCLY